MNTFRTRLRHAGPQRRLIATIVAIVALATQAVTPHLHTWQSDAGHGRGVQLAGDHAVRGEPGTLRAEQAEFWVRAVSNDDSDTHDAATCPVCRTLAQHRLAPVVVAAAFDPPPASSLLHDVRTELSSSAAHDAAGPRAPPAPSASLV